MVGGEPRFTERLRSHSEPAWTNATNHQFTHELAAGTLADDALRRYLIQDYAFVETLTGLVGSAVVTAPSMAEKRRLTDFLVTLTGAENDYFERSFAALSVDEAAWKDPQKLPVTQALEDLFVRATHQGGYAESLAVLVPAEWVYLSWARPHRDAAPEKFYHEEWIAMHASAEFEAFVSWLRAQLDEQGATLSPQRTARVRRLFSRTVELEVAFFDAAYGI
ncbi:TenA family protein [Haladaptatus sp. DJG-WS-42]|uniref:TenA family protein n=1 Tax=Haladaptatus sp. DJG-WS-42 TaxID=3120516 RepID=UPI0030D40702